MEDFNEGMDLSVEDPTAEDTENAPAVPMGVINLSIFSMDVMIFISEDDRLKELRRQGLEPVKEDTPFKGLAVRDFDKEGNPVFSMVFTPEGALDPSTWAHEATHTADLVMDSIGMPGTLCNTEMRAYLVEFLFNGICKILEGLEHFIFPNEDRPKILH